MKHQAKRYSVEMMSRVPGVSRSGYYKWVKSSHLKVQLEVLDKQIKDVFEQSACRYGSPRVCEAVNKIRSDKKVSSSTGARRMRVLKLKNQFTQKSLDPPKIFRPSKNL